MRGCRSRDLSLKFPSRSCAGGVIRIEKMLAQWNLAREEFELIEKAQETLGEELEDVLKQAREIEKQIGEAFKALIFGFGSELVTPRIDELKTKYEGETVHAYLENVRHHLLENLESFVQRDDGEGSKQLELASLLQGQRDRYLEYRVNLLVDNSAAKRAPIVIENHPTYRNLFGTIERSWDRAGQSQTDFTRIKAGSLLLADGGYLVISLLDMLSEPGVYQSMKRTLKHDQVDIQGIRPDVFRRDGDETGADRGGREGTATGGRAFLPGPLFLGSGLSKDLQDQGRLRYGHGA